MTGGEPKTLQLLRDLFGGKSNKRREDVAAWLLDADEAALARLAAMKPPKHKTLWRTLGLYLDMPDEKSCVRCLRLVQTAKSEDDLLFWIVRHGGGPWIATFHRWLNRKRGGRIVPFPTQESIYEQTTEARSLLLEDLRGDEALFGVAFEALDCSLRQSQAWRIAPRLGFAERADGGRHHRTVRWLGRVVLIEEKRKVKIHVLESEASAQALVVALPPVEAIRQRYDLFEKPGVVSVWVNAVLDPRGTLDGKGGPLKWYDHDYHEVADGSPEVILPRFSHGASFAPAAIDRAAELGLTDPAQIDVLFDHWYAGPPGRYDYGWFLGAFPFER